MSQLNSDPLFDSVEFSSPMPMDAAPIGQPGGQTWTTPAVHGFTIHTVLLIVSFLMLTTAAILLFMDAGKY